MLLVTSETDVCTVLCVLLVTWCVSCTGWAKNVTLFSTTTSV